MKAILLVIMMFLFGCASNAKTDAPKVEKEVNHAQKHELVQIKKDKKELVVMLCQATKHTQARQVWAKEKMTLVKQSSPTIFTLSWSDSRSAKQVIGALKNSGAIFCGVESNQTYSNQITGER